MIVKGLADGVLWLGRNHVLEQEPEAVTRRLGAVKEQALLEVRCGHRAAKAMEGYGSHYRTRAGFLALRRDSLEGWQARNGIDQWNGS
jgi:hypothetical protein